MPEAPKPAITLIHYRKYHPEMSPHQFAEKYNLITLISLFGAFLCSDLKDNVYALLSKQKTVKMTRS